MSNRTLIFTFALGAILASCGRNSNTTIDDALSNVPRPYSYQERKQTKFNHLLSYHEFVQAPDSSPFDILVVLDQSISASDFNLIRNELPELLKNLTVNHIHFHLGFIDSTLDASGKPQSELLGPHFVIESSNPEAPIWAKDNLDAFFEKLKDSGVSTVVSAPVLAVLKTFDGLAGDKFYRPGAYRYYLAFTNDQDLNSNGSNEQFKNILYRFDAQASPRNWSFQFKSFSKLGCPDVNAYDAFRTHQSLLGPFAIRSFVEMSGARYLRCDSGVASVLTDTRSEILDMRNRINLRNIVPDPVEWSQGYSTELSVVVNHQKIPFQNYEIRMQELTIHFKNYSPPENSVISVNLELYNPQP